ncbi:MAG: pilus assembly FimT family protein [Longimicrobiales bacterium]
MHGFTLIEMTIVLLVLGMALSLAVPPLMGWQRNMEIASSMDRFERVHELSRITAIREGRIAELHIDASTTRFWVEVDTSGTGVRDTVSMVAELAEGVSFTSDRTLLCFDGRGLPTATGACEAPDVTVAFTAVNGQVDTTRTTLLGKVIR